MEVTDNDYDDFEGFARRHRFGAALHKFEADITAPPGRGSHTREESGRGLWFGWIWIASPVLVIAGALALLRAVVG